MEGEEPSRKDGRGTRISRYFSGAVSTFPGMPKTSFKGIGEDAQSHHYEQSSFSIMKEMSQIMANIQEASRPPAFNTQSMNAPDCFDWIKRFKVRSFIQSCTMIFHNDQEDFSEEKEALYEN
ncbi:hypothetical protein O181_122878 [Austropuccinia psidii MF-1]|uniref:Uncharacterized protein n=1 Tax=Austropuccinia psidii MF-1 TaxID=1389203 RepID=A0A9Q3KKP9_9BASI|nr:hypothetical protein [Austropuccinia psidii MF-1]